MTPHPPKPRLTLRVGITGHRPNKLDAAGMPRLRQQLAGIFAAIEQAAVSIHTDAKSFYTDEAPALRLVSGFAEGVDQMAVAVCPQGWQIDAILPFPTDEYLKDFAVSAGDGRNVQMEFRECLKKATAIAQLPAPQAGMRNQSYADAGGYLLRQIDLLVAVWDGLPPLPGGTGAIAREAHLGGIPVVWLSTRETRAPRLIAGFDDTGTPKADDKDCTTGPLVAVLDMIFKPAAAAADHPLGSDRTGLKQFLAERWRRCCIFTPYDLLRSVANLSRPRLFFAYPTYDQRSHDWDQFLQSAPDAKDLRERITGVLLPRHIWADTLAVHFSHLYRSTYVFAYLLSAIAVFIALGTVLIHDDHTSPSAVLGTKAIIVSVELVVIGLIMLVVLLGRHLLWHERWINYRMLAEMLRHGRFLAFVSEFGRIQDREPQRDRLWMLWYIRATMREIGLPTATFDGAYQKGVLNATLQDEIVGDRGQLEYHQRTRKVVHRIDHLLHWTGTICFVATAMILFLFLALFGLHQAFGLAPLETVLLAIKSYVTFLSAGLPALGAAVAGIRVHGDFEGLTERSDEMVVELSGLRDDYAKALARDVRLNETAETLIVTAGAMSEDLAVWQGLYGRKRLALPA